MCKIRDTDKKSTKLKKSGIASDKVVGTVAERYSPTKTGRGLN